MFLLRERGTGIPNNENTPLVWMPNRERIFDHLSKNELSIGEESNKAYGLTETLVWGGRAGKQNSIETEENAIAIATGFKKYIPCFASSEKESLLRSKRHYVILIATIYMPIIT